ncbi:MAG: type II secretion system protein GspG [Deltaproteobacteria bacterium]|nr:type II secretion system protein GspG [Deltaproteobacteria bacterium]
MLTDLTKMLRRLLDEKRRALSGGERRRGEGGMTLIEIMVVVAIIAVIAGGVSIWAVGALKRAQVKTCKGSIQELEKAIELYQTQTSESCPKELAALVKEGILKKQVPKDPWGEDFIYKCPGEENPDGVDISSKGPNKRSGDKDDINSWDM